MKLTKKQKTRKMTAHFFTALFYFLLFLLMCGTLLCGQVCAKSITPSFNSGDTFTIFEKNEQINNADQLGAQGVIVNEYYSPVFVSAGDVFVALAEVNRTTNPEKHTDILTKYIKKEEMLNKDDVAGTSSKWGKHLLVWNEGQSEVVKVVKGMLAVAAGKNVYVLHVNHTKKRAEDSNDLNLAFHFAVGAVNDGEREPEKNFVWNKNDSPVASVTEKLREKFGEEQLDIYFFGGSAFLADDGKIVFALLAGNFQKKILALMQLNSNVIESESVYTEIPDSCFPYFFPWNKKIMMIFVNCANDEKKILESGDMGKNWSASTEALSRYYGFLRDKYNFATVKNGTKEVVLFTEDRSKLNANSNGKSGVYLWMSDGNRLHSCGKIASDVNAAALISFSFANNKLFTLNPHVENIGITSVTLTRHQEVSNNIMSTLIAWNTTDAKILQLCKTVEASKIPCNTDGLVSFLSGTEEESSDKWKDEYLNKDATVTSTKSKGKAKKIQGGFTFSGAGVGAKWEIGEGSKDQPYNFIDSGFTLVATVKIDKNEKELNNSVLGFVSYDNVKPVRLWCSNGRWTVNNEKNKAAKEEECKHEHTYSVALVLNNNNMSVYVDWEQLIALGNEAINIQKDSGIKHLYFGADTGGAGGAEVQSHVTVTNVLLYNRPFYLEDIESLKQKVKPVEDTKTPDEKKGNKGGSTNENEKGFSPSRTEDGGVGGGVRVFSLLLAVLCVSAPLLHL